MIKKLFLFAFVLLNLSALGQVCRADQYDMLSWMAPQVATKNGHFNVVYPRTGVFYWVKGQAGYPWDVDLFDETYIYQWGTEYTWNDPSTYKNFQHALPWMPRCINRPATPGKLTEIDVPSEQSNFDIHTSCTSAFTRNLGHVINEVWGPYVQNIGSTPSAPTLTLSYRYNCNNQYSQCTDKETFDLQQDNGMVQWTHYVLQNGQYQKVQSTVHGTASVGTVTPLHPCWNDNEITPN